MERHSISLIGFSVFFGSLLGFSVLLALFYASGVFEDERITADRVPTGMEILETYQCQKAETKQILVGGVEDNFDPAGEEPSNPNEKMVRYLVSLEEGRTRSDIVKTYDNPQQDRHFSDRFDIPLRTFSGLVVVSVKELSDLKNDGLSLGYKNDESIPYINYESGYKINVSKLPTAAIWGHHNSVYFAALKDLMTPEQIEDKRSLLEIIRTSDENDGDFFVDIADDTVVDFIGFALCLEPEDDLGTVYSQKHPSRPGEIRDVGPGIIGLNQGTIEGKFCSYAGCLACEAERPLACIKDSNLPLPDTHDPNLKVFWTGGEFKFTPPVRGSSFNTEDDVDAYCSTEFGRDWRALSRHDGWSGGTVSGLGAFPSGYETVWVNVKNSDHHNCWKPRPDYEALDDG